MFKLHTNLILNCQGALCAYRQSSRSDKIGPNYRAVRIISQWSKFASEGAVDSTQLLQKQDPVSFAIQK